MRSLSETQMYRWFLIFKKVDKFLQREKKCYASKMNKNSERIRVLVHQHRPFAIHNLYEKIIPSYRFVPCLLMVEVKG